MRIKSLFEYAAIIQDRKERRGEIGLKHHTILALAAVELVEGYSSLNEANEENQTRLSPYGFEIAPSAVYDAANYLKCECK